MRISTLFRPLSGWLSLLLLTAIAAGAQLPTPPHPFDLGYFQIDGQWGPAAPDGNGDHGSEVNCYTDSFYATRLDHGNVPDPFEALSHSLDRAANAGKVVQLALDFSKDPLEIAPGEGCPASAALAAQVAIASHLLDLATPYWSQVARLELVDEPNWRTDQTDPDDEGPALASEINCRVLKVQELLAEKSLPYRPIGLTHQSKWFANLPPDAMASSDVDWVGMSAYLDSADDALSLEALREKFDKRMAKAVKWGGGKPVVWVMQAYDLTHTWNNLGSLVELQRWTYELAATESVTSSDPNVGTQTFETAGLLMFSYGRTGGTREYPALAAAHRDIAVALFGLPAPPTCGNPPSSGPSNLQITGEFGRYIDLAWLPGTQTANRYRIFQHNGDGNWHPGGDVNGSAHTATATVGLPGLPGVGLARCFRIRGYYGDGHPLDTNEVCTIVFRDPPVAPPVPQSPVGCVDTLRPTLHWDTAPDATGYYVVLKRLFDGEFVFNDPNVVDNSYPLFSDLDRGVRYAWKVKACNNQGCSSTYSPYVEFQPLCTPRSDFDGDGKTDVLFRHLATGELSTWLLDGVSRLDSRAFSPARPVAGNWALVGTNDFSRDGRPDLLWRNTDSGNFSLWYLNGVVRTAGFVLAGRPDANDRVVGTGDFNHDGKPDILWHHATTGALSVSFLDGPVITGSAALSPAVLQPAYEVAAVGDLNGDRNLDLLVRSLSTAALEAWFFDGIIRTGTAAITASGTPDLGWKVVAIEDLDRDGANDIVWQNATSNRLVAWFMDGSGVAQKSGTLFSPDGSSDFDLKAIGPR